MKNILLFISFFLMFLLGAKDVNAALPIEEGGGVEAVLQTDVPVNKVEAYVDMNSLTGQWRISGRGQRSLSVQQVVVGKNLVYQAAKKRLEILFHSTYRVYTSLPCQSWAVSSEHYVFGMRRILI